MQVFLIWNSKGYVSNCVKIEISLGVLALLTVCLKRHLTCSYFERSSFVQVFLIWNT